MTTTETDPDLQDTARDTAHVIARPPLIVLATFALGLAAAHLLPLPPLIPKPSPAHWVSATLAALAVVAGVALIAAGIQNFLRAATPVPTNEPTKALVTTGIHGWTRNPIYLGMVVVFVGLAVAMRSTWLLILAVPLALVLHHGVIAKEEAYLETRFGEDYRRYKAAVRRWI